MGETERSLWSRRQLLLHLGAATGAALLQDLNALAGPQRRRRVVIVGAGLAGLCAAYELEQRGHTVVLLEAETSHVGGRVRTRRFDDGLYGELGAMRIPASHHLTRYYIRQFGLPLRPFVQFNPHAFYYVHGRRERIAQVRHLDHRYTEGMERRAGSIWAQQFDEIEGGMDRLPRAFATRLRSNPRTGCAVIRLEQDQARGRVAAIYREQGADGTAAGHPEQRVEGDFLLCTIPLPVLRHLKVTPPFSSGQQRAMRELSYLAANKVLMLTASRFWEADDGIFGGGTYTDSPSGVTYYPSDNAQAKSHDVSSHPGVLLASYTIGHAAQRLAGLPPDERAALVLRCLARVHPQLRQSGMARQTVCWSWDNHQWTGGGFAAPDHRQDVHRQLIAPEGCIFFAGEHTSLVHTWMQGALESALRAVKEMLAVST